jgi:putative redox protein
MEMEVVFTGNKKVEAHLRGFTILTDQPAESGGDNTAPTPFEYFLSSIGTCVGYFILKFCQERNIPTDKIKIIQKMERNPETNLVNDIALEIKLPPDFPDKYKNALIKVAETCTVKKHLQNPPRIHVSTVTKNKSSGNS